MENRVILLVEDNPRDEASILHALKKSKIANEIVVTRDGVEALDYLFETGAYAARDTRRMPRFVLLDLKLPHIDGLSILRQIRTNERTKGLPVVVFTSSREEEDLIDSYNLGANSYVRKPVDFEEFLEATRQLGLYWLVLNQVPRVLIVDDHEVVREGVKTMLEEQTGPVTFGQASTAAEAFRLTRERDWDVAVVDPALEHRTGLEVLKDLKQMRPHLPVLILSAHSEEHYARRAFKAGAAGFITKDSPSSELVNAVSKVLAGGKYVSSALAERLVVDLERGTDRPPHETLSDREFEVLKLIASGKTVGEIAALLALSDRTISTYRSRILEKMEMKTNAELTHYAIQSKLVD